MQVATFNNIISPIDFSCNNGTGVLFGGGSMEGATGQRPPLRCLAPTTLQTRLCT